MAAHTEWNESAAEPLILFGSFRLLPNQRLLMHADERVRLGSRAFDLLIALLGRPGELVTKEELIAKVWPNTFVGPANLAVHISVLRRALGDGHAGNRYVVNIHGRGYRFVAPVTIVEGPPRLAPAVTQASDPSIWSPPMRSIERTVHHHAVELAHAYLLTLARLAADKTGVSIALVPDTVSLHQDGVSLVKLNTGENQ